MITGNGNLEYPFYISRSVVCVTTALAILIEHQLVTDSDTQTDRYRAIAYSPLAYRRAVKMSN